MDLPFKKIATITDCHFGRNGSSPQANQDNLDFLEWFIDKAQTWGAEAVCVMGDWHDSRFSIQLGTLDASLKGMEMLAAAFKTYFLTGNHDLMYREKRDVASTIFAKNIPNVHFINQPMTLGEGKDSATFLPWLIADEKKLARAIKSRYVFSHLELPGFMMNERVPMPIHGDGATLDDFGKPEFVFSGHFHFRQFQKNIVYTGNIMPFNFADDHDSDRGAMFLEWGKDPFFEAWPDQPLFRTLLLSDLIADPGKHLRPKLTARVTMDLPITFEETQFIKDDLAKQFSLRKLELIAPSTSDHASEEARLEMVNVVYQTVDQLVLAGIQKMEVGDFDSKMLSDIYIDLVETAEK